MMSRLGFRKNQQKTHATGMTIRNNIMTNPTAVSITNTAPKQLFQHIDFCIKIKFLAL